MPDTVVEMAPRVFRDRALTQVILSRNLKEIPKDAFRDCASLQYIAMPAALCAVGEDAFYGCVALNTVDVADVDAWCGVEFANQWANPLYCGKTLFVQGKPVSEVVLSDAFRGEIKPYAFINSDITSLVLPEGVSAIGAYAFAYTMLESVTLPDSVTEVAEAGFLGCVRLKKLDLGKGLTTIGPKAFYINRVEQVVIPESVTAIGERAFEKSALKQVVIENENATIDRCAFLGCPLQDFDLGHRSQWDSSILSGTNVSFLKIPDEMTILKNQFFSELKSLAVLVIPETVTTVEYGALTAGIQHVLYAGTEEQWANISQNVRLASTGTVHYGAAGDEITVTESCTQVCYHCAICDQTICVDKKVQTHKFEAINAPCAALRMCGNTRKTV
jgi:hypothetical protein